MASHHEHREVIYEKKVLISDEWSVTTKASSQKERLLDSYARQRFLSAYRDLMWWIASMKSPIDTDKMATELMS